MLPRQIDSGEHTGVGGRWTVMTDVTVWDMFPAMRVSLTPWHSMTASMSLPHRGKLEMSYNL